MSKVRRVRPGAKGTIPSARQRDLARWAKEEWGRILASIPRAADRRLLIGPQAAHEIFARGMDGADCDEVSRPYVEAAAAHPQGEELRWGLFLSLVLDELGWDESLGDFVPPTDADEDQFARVARVAFARSVSQRKILTVVQLNDDGGVGICRED